MTRSPIEGCACVRREQQGRKRQKRLGAYRPQIALIVRQISFTSIHTEAWST